MALERKSKDEGFSRRATDKAKKRSQIYDPPQLEVKANEKIWRASEEKLNEKQAYPPFRPGSMAGIAEEASMSPTPATVGNTSKEASVSPTPATVGNTSKEELLKSSRASPDARAGKDTADVKIKSIFSKLGFEENSEFNIPDKNKQLFVDAKKMKDKLRENMHKPQYDVQNFYKSTGWAQAIAVSNLFDNITMGVIALNVVWIAIDTDLNKQPTLLQSDPIFIIMENLFCVFFTSELAVRFAAFYNKCDCLKDAWFVFDLILVCVMITETWIVFTFMAVVGIQNINLGSGALMKIVRILRLSRMARMARVLRSMPELLILIKGMVAAMRAVFFTLVLLFLLLYVFAIYFRQMAKDFPGVEKDFFSNIPTSLQSLLMHGVFLDSIGNLVAGIELEKDAYQLLFPFYLFVLLGALTIMNMLIGVLCEVVSAVAATEREGLTMVYTKNRLQEIICESLGLEDFDETTFEVSKSGFLTIFHKRETARLLAEIEVDVLALVDLVDTIFTRDDGTEKVLTFGSLVEVMLDQRRSNTATVRDLTDMRKYIRCRTESLHEKCDEVLETKEKHMIRVHAQLSVLGGMIEKHANVKPGTFEKRSAELYDEGMKIAEELEQRKRAYAVEAKRKREEEAVKAMKEQTDKLEVNKRLTE